MSTSTKVALAVFAVVAVAPLFVAHAAGAPAGDKLMGSCSGGQINWSATDGGLGMSAKPDTLTLSGKVSGCTGTPGVTGATFTGVQKATSASCTSGIEGPIDVTLNWNNGKTSRVTGNWNLQRSGAANNSLEVVSGLGKGEKITISTDRRSPTPADLTACADSTLTSGTTTVAIASIG